MNNSTTTEALPKTGHVNEVCKEWLVREDGALAYKLQSQEINDFYKGNRQRNAVVREDFPTALHEQIKERENAQKQVEAYRRRLTEQEEHDKRVAKEIADKLERDIQEQQQRELLESEEIAMKMQEIYVNMPPLPPPVSRQKPPPRPAKASIMQQSTVLAEQQPTTSNGTRHSRSQLAQQQYQNTHHSNHNTQQQPQQLQQQQHQQLQFFADTNGYVGLSVNMPTTPQRQKSHANSNQLMKLSPEKYDQMMGNQDGDRVREQQNADDIELYVDPCDYESLKEIGLPMEEIKEISKKLKQEQKDALLAKRLQEMESHENMSQEERDRLLAIEAQDKELARMLQEREKAKVKRAKEKARIRKSQQQQKDTSCSSTSTSLHCGPLLPLPQDCLPTSKQRHTVTSSPPYTSAPRYQPQLQAEDLIDMEAYSNPIDVINSANQIRPNGTLTNGSLTRDPSRQHNNSSNGSSNSHIRDDDIYTLPVDSCRPTTNQRPASLILPPDTVNGHNNSMTRSENYSMESHGSLNGHHEISPRMNFSKSAVLDQSSSPTPPYMPIQGTRRSNSGEERKKKSKDKCTHQ